MTLTYGLLGRYLGHSYSRLFFEEKFRKEGIDARYQNFELAELSGFADVIAHTPGLRGLNVTIPFKETIIPHLSDLTPEARAVGAVNTILVEGSQLTGHNTDAGGFLKALRPFLTKDHSRALILGDGGAAKAVRYALSTLGADALMVSRKPIIPGKTIEWKDLSPQVISHFKLIVNCTPLGTFPDVRSYPHIPFEGIGPDHVLMDLVYNPPLTRFMELGRQYGAVAINGLDMLRFQAELSWEFWQKDTPNAGV